MTAFHPFRNEEKPELTVMTWNVHCPRGADSIRQRKIAELILVEDADFILLNEYCQDSCAVMDSMLRMRYPYLEETFSHKNCGDIYYSKHKMKNSGKFLIRLLKRFQPSLGGESYPDSLRGRSPLAIVATIPVGGDTVKVFGMHFMNNNCNGISNVDGYNSLESIHSYYRNYKKAQSRRLFEAYWLKEAAAEAECPVIVMGDMNDFNCSAPLETLTSCGLKDSWWEGGFGYGSTFHAGWMRLRIDHILHSDKLKLESIKVIETNLSDHNPVVAGFNIVKN